MRLCIGCISVLLSTSLLGKVNYPCSGAPGVFYVNPDSTLGGFVASTATVDSTVTISLEAAVCERATVVEGAKVTGRAEISGRATLRGKVNVTDVAKVYGDAYLVNLHGTDLEVRDQARIYGYGFLQGDPVLCRHGSKTGK